MTIEIERIRSRLTSMPGIRGVDLSSYPDKITIRCEPDGLRKAMAEKIQGLVREESGHTVPTIEVEASDGPSGRQGRARFEAVEIRRTGRATLAARVVLDWQKQQVVGEAEGEASQAGELRACCLATLRAVEGAAARDLSFNLVGAKELYVFDHNLIAVLVHSPQLPGHRLIGTSIINGDRRKAAALAVLSATNRAFGRAAETQEG